MTQFAIRDQGRQKGLPDCPVCAGTKLEALRHAEDYSPFLMRYCPKCLGIWGTDSAIGNGLSMYRMPHEALRVGGGQRKCRKCPDGVLSEGDVCANCGDRREALQCPECDRTMVTVAVEGVLLDTCEECDGIWLDRGELSRVFGPVEMRPMTGHEDEAAVGADHDWEDDVRPSGIDVAVRFLEILFGRTR